MSDNRELSGFAGKRRRRVERESPDMAAFVGRVARAMVRRAGEGDLEALTALRAMSEAIEQATEDAARALHDDPFGPGTGYSWTVIGAELGITRQAARQRFAG